MKSESKQRLHVVLEACKAVARFADGVEFEVYLAIDMLRLGVERKLEVIGEAFAKVENTDSAMMECFPDFQKIIGLRNRIIHG